MSVLDQARTYWRFALGLRNFLKEQISLEQSREIIRERLQNREGSLLAIVKKAIYENKSSPYLKLLRSAGCEFDDFKQMVVSEGIEPALRKLSKESIYITVDEFKGKKEVIRGSETFSFKEKDFDNPFLSQYFEARSGASRSAGTRILFDFDFLAQESVYYSAILDANHAYGDPFSLWVPILPGGGPLIMLLFRKGGKPPVKWFSPVDEKGFMPSLKHRLGNNYIVWVGKAFGAKWSGPDYVAMDEALIVARWIAQTLKELGGCCLNTYVSAAVRVCQAARENNLDISGAKFIVSGEPLTQTKIREIESVGATAFCYYWFTEAGFIGGSCPNSTEGDMHLYKDSVAVIQHQREVPHAKVSVDAFLFTSLLPSAPKVLLNVESGDYGEIDTRSCGCRFDDLGLIDHIYNVRGFDKLTSAGMTFVGTDLIRIIEEVLPAKFGGAYTDYQMVEEEDDKGHTRMSVIVSPEVGPIDEEELIQTIINELRKGEDTQRMMAEVWLQAKTLRVKRNRPLTTARGKLLPLHIQKWK